MLSAISRSLLRPSRSLRLAHLPDFHHSNHLSTRGHQIPQFHTPNIDFPARRSFVHILSQLLLSHCEEYLQNLTLPDVRDAIVRELLLLRLCGGNSATVASQLK